MLVEVHLLLNLPDDEILALVDGVEFTPPESELIAGSIRTILDLRGKPRAHPSHESDEGG